MNYTTMFGAVIKILGQNGVQYGFNAEMAEKIELWSRMYENKAPWLSKRILSANIPATEAYETAKLVLLEFKSEITGSQCADYINKIYQERVIKGLSHKVEYGLAKGSFIIKPIADKEGIRVQFVQADCFFPIDFDSSGELLKCAFADQLRCGRSIYTLIEIHTLNGGVYTIENRLFRSENDGLLGSETTLSEIEKWSKLPREFKIVNVPKMPFGFFRCPMANQVDSTSPLGVSMYSRVVEQIAEADRRYSGICWEYKGTQLAVHIAESMLEYDADNDKWKYPGGEERLYRKVQYNAGASEKPLIDVFSPQIRATELFTGYNNQLRMIEFGSSLAYGTLSDPSTVDKTATEVKYSQHRSYSFVSSVQLALGQALRDFADACAFWISVYDLVPIGDYEVSFDFDDSIINDPIDEREQDRRDVAMGAMPVWEYRMKWYHEDEKTARRMTDEANAGVLE